MRVLAIGANPWDVIAYCGGTLARYAQRGDVVTVAPLLDASSGAGEAAAELLGAAYVTDVLSGTTLDDVRTSRDEVMDVIRAADPEVIVASSPSSACAAERQVARLVFHAAYCACVPNYPSPRGLDAATTRAPILNMDAVGAMLDDAPTYVDIGSTWEAKARALALFAVAEGRPSGAGAAAERAEIVSRARGIQTQVEFAEAFAVEPAWGRLRTRRLVP